MNRNKKPTRSDNVYFLKLVLYMIVGSQWLFINDGGSGIQLPMPVGLVIGVAFASHEHFKLDRKIEYAILLMTSAIGYWANIGLAVWLD